MSMPVDVDVGATQLAQLKALAEPLRWSIVQALASEELCVCHLTEDLDAPQPLISHHLRVLRDAGIVESEKWRYWTYYRLCPDVVTELGRGLATLAAFGKRRGQPRRPCC